MNTLADPITESSGTPVVDGLRGGGALGLRRDLQVVDAQPRVEVLQLLLDRRHRWVRAPVGQPRQRGWQSHLRASRDDDYLFCAQKRVTVLH